MAGVLGPLTPNTLSDPLVLDRKLAREQLLTQSKGSDFFQAAIVLEIDPIGGLFGNNGETEVGCPRFSIRARILNQTAEGGNADFMNDTDQLPVYFPFEPNYHEYNPIKVGEKVWVFELNGLQGTVQRFWKSRINSPAALDLADFVRPTNNYSDASYEANIGREPDSPIQDVNLDRRISDTVDKVASRDPSVFGDVDIPDNARSSFSRVTQDSALKYGFVNEAFPEWFYRPSDKVGQGSNNSGYLFGTNMFTIESEEDVIEDIADLMSIFGASNDASDFSNANDREVMVADRSLISVNAKEKTALGILVAGREYYVNSFTFDSSTLAVFENFTIDSIPAFSSALESIGGTNQEESPSLLARSSNIRLWARDTVVVGIDNGNGMFMSNEDNGTFISKFDGSYLFKSVDTELQIDPEIISLSIGGSTIGMSSDSIEINALASSISMNSSGISMTTSNLNLSSVTQFSFPATITTGGPISFASPASFGTAPIPVVNKTTMDALSAAIVTASGNPALAAAGPAAPAIVAVLTQIAASINGLPYSPNLSG